MSNGSVLELSYPPSNFGLIKNPQTIKVDGKIFYKGVAIDNHSTINGWDFSHKPMINHKDGVINGGEFDNLENHGILNNVRVILKNGNFIDTFKNDGIINGGMFGAKNIYNSGNITSGDFAGIVHNDNGTISGGFFQYLELNSGQAQNIKIHSQIIIKGGSVGNITFLGRYNNSQKTPSAIKNEAGVQIDKITINGKIKIDAKELNNVKIVELSPSNRGEAILFLDQTPDFSKIIGKGTIKVGDISYNTDGVVISSSSPNAALINDSFKLTKAVNNLKEQKYLLDDQMEQNNQIELLSLPADEIVI